MDESVYRRMNRDGKLAVLQEYRRRATSAAPRARRYLLSLEGRQRNLSDQLVASEATGVELDRLTIALDELRLVETAIRYTNRRLREIARSLRRIERQLRVADTGAPVPVPTRDELEPPRDRRRRTTRTDRRIRINAEGETEQYEVVVAIVARYKSAITGRQNGERAFRRVIRPYLEALALAPIRRPRVHRRLPSLPEWASVVENVSQIAVLHNPDQIAGGYDDFPTRDQLNIPAGEVMNDDTWRTWFNGMFQYLGLGVVNSQIGGQWDRVMRAQPALVQQRVRSVAQFITTLNVRLTAYPAHG
jgi:hypothetical protein